MSSFEWERLGDIAIGRENLGAEMPIAVYRLLMYNLMDELEGYFGPEQRDEIIRKVGFRAGLAIADNLLEPGIGFNAGIAELQKTLKELKIGIMRIEAVDRDNKNIVLTISEDLDCSGLPISGEAVCIYDEGLIGGALYSITGEKYTVTEVDCWATGDRTCRFEASLC